MYALVTLAAIVVVVVEPGLVFLVHAHTHVPHTSLFQLYFFSSTLLYFLPNEENLHKEERRAGREGQILGQRSARPLYGHISAIPAPYPPLQGTCSIVVGQIDRFLRIYFALKPSFLSFANEYL